MNEAEWTVFYNDIKDQLDPVNFECDEECQEKFTTYDDNADQLMQLEEFQHFFTDQCSLCPFDSAATMFNFFDLNDDGVLDMEEWAATWAYVQAKDWDGDDIDDPCMQEMRRYDDDNDWYMTLEEFTAYFMDKCGLCPQDSAAAMFAEYNTDNSDGRDSLDRDEWRELWNFVQSLEDDDDTTPPVEPWVEDWQTYNDDEDMFLSLEEFTDFYEDKCALCPWEAAQAMFNEYDADQDGFLSDAEFKAAWDFANEYDPNEDDDVPDPNDDDEEECECEADDK